MQPARTNYAYPDTSGRDRAAYIRIPLSMALLSAGIASVNLSPVTAQVADPTAQATAASPDAIKQREQELEAARATPQPG